MKVLRDELVNRHFGLNLLPHVRFEKPTPKSSIIGIESEGELRQVLGERVAVLGFDMYKYSDLAENKQIFVPPLIETLRLDAWSLAVANFPFIFQKYYSDDRKTLRRKPNEIDTGDGGFVFFDTPLHAICFLISFSALLRLYNSHMFLPELRDHIGPVDIRFALTLDNVYTYHKKFYGSGIINNARILARDKLNRFLLDKNVVDWFLGSLIGIERLEVVTLEEVSEIPEFAMYDKSWITEMKNAVIVPFGHTSTERIKSVDLLKIGEIEEKRTKLDIYNVSLKVVTELESQLLGLKNVFALSIGNMNTADLR